MIVAVSHFNMGAMENKGLNIFNSKYVLSDINTATDQDIIDIGGSTYLEEKKEKEARRNAGESLQGVVTSEAEGDDVATDSPKKLKDPLLEIFNIVPDKVARGIAKKATVFGKRNKLEFINVFINIFNFFCRQFVFS